jgi:hypothetical protein
MKKNIFFVAIASLAIILVGAGCDYTVNIQDNNKAPEQSQNTSQPISGEQKTDVVAPQTENTNQPQAEKKAEQPVQAEISSVNKYTGVIKEYTDGGYGDVSYYIELANSTKQGIKVCDKRAGKLNDQIISLAGTNTSVDLYSNAAQTGGACVNGIVVNLSEKSVKYSGLVKQYTDGGYGDISYYIESTDGTKAGIKACDKRVGGIWSQTMAVADTNLTVDLYSNQNQNGGACVNGIVVNY